VFFDGERKRIFFTLDGWNGLDGIDGWHGWIDGHANVLGASFFSPVLVLILILILFLFLPSSFLLAFLHFCFSRLHTAGTFLHSLGVILIFFLLLTYLTFFVHS
jgi:hypothetical protein